MALTKMLKKIKISLLLILLTSPTLIKASIDLKSGDSYSINNTVLLQESQLDIDNVRLDGNALSITQTDGDLNLNANGTGKAYLWSDLVVDSNGRLGIGTTSPASVLHIVENTYTSSNPFKFLCPTLGVSGTNIRRFVLGKAESANNSLEFGFNRVADDSASNFINLGLYSNTNTLCITGTGNVGIGITNPDTKLHVEGTIEVDQKIQANDSGGLELATDEGTTRLLIKDDGNIGIGGDPGGYKVRIYGSATSTTGRFGDINISSNEITNGSGSWVLESSDRIYVRPNQFWVEAYTLMTNDVRMTWAYSNELSTYKDAVIESDGSIGVPNSSRRAKINIIPIEDASYIYKLEPVRFNPRKKISTIRDLQENEEDYYTDEYHPKKRLGLIADDVEQYVPECVWRDDIKDENGKVIGSKVVGLDYKMLVAPMIKCIQEQKIAIQELKNANALQQTMLDELENKNNELGNRISILESQ
ncbi:tail fiber domain-containing protein [Candidatus Margulisiibacteriota bacterium]